MLKSEVKSKIRGNKMYSKVFSRVQSISVVYLYTHEMRSRAASWPVLAG